MASHLQSYIAGGNDMLRLLKKLLLFRIGQKTSRRVTRMIGLDSLAAVVGIVGGIKYMRRHS